MGVCVARWLALPAHLRREAAPARSGNGPVAANAGRAAAVREERRHRRTGGQAGSSLAGEKAAAISGDRGQGAAAPGREAVAAAAGGEAAGLAALRDLAAGPSQVGQVRGWLRPEDFAVPGHGAVYELMRDMDVAGRPVDPVTVSWEAARRGLPVDADALAGGTGAFAVASARQVHRLGLLTQAAQAGWDIQADAADLTCPPRHLLLAAHERLRVLEAVPQPQARPGRDAQAASRAGRSAVGRRAARPEREAVP